MRLLLVADVYVVVVANLLDDEVVEVDVVECSWQCCCSCESHRCHC